MRMIVVYATRRLVIERYRGGADRHAGKIQIFLQSIDAIRPLLPMFFSFTYAFSFPTVQRVYKGEFTRSTLGERWCG